MASEKWNLNWKARRINPELQPLLTRVLQGLPLIWDKTGMESHLTVGSREGFSAGAEKYFL